VWWARGDLNPGPPPCQGGVCDQEGLADDTGSSWSLTTPLPSPPRPPVDKALVEGFRQWLRGKVSEDTAEYYARVVERGEWPPAREKHVKAWRKYVHYLFSLGRLTWEQYQAYLLYLKAPSSEHRTVAAVGWEEIRGYGERLEQAGLGRLHLLLLGGARLKHIELMLEQWRPDEVVQHPHERLEPRLYCAEGWCRYYLGVQEGSKRVDYVYYPAPWDRERPLDPQPYRQLKDRLRRLGVQPSRYRKYANQRLAELAHEHSIPQDAVALIMSRGLSVTGTHYLNTRDWADQLFKEYTMRITRQYSP